MMLASRAAGAVTPEESALAEELFRTGKEEMAAGRYDVACPKLAESQRIDPGSGTVLALALCYEEAGRTASAWATYNEAIAWAKREDRRNREAVAQERVAAIFPRLVRIRLVVSGAARNVSGLSLARDGLVLAPAGWDTAVPVDPGKHTIIVYAPGHVSQRIEVRTGAEGSTTDVAIPALERASTGASTRDSTRAAPQQGELHAAARETPADVRSNALVYLGVGASVSALTSLAIGTGFAVDARSKQAEADQRCPARACDDRDAIDLSARAGRHADVAAVFFVVGGVTAVVAIAAFALHATGLLRHHPFAARPAVESLSGRGLTLSF
jgi:serine/threonine-protein kinase